MARNLRKGSLDGSRPGSAPQLPPIGPAMALADGVHGSQSAPPLPPLPVEVGWHCSGQCQQDRSVRVLATAVQQRSLIFVRPCYCQTLQGTEPGAPGHVAAVVATLSERSLRAMARAAAEAAAAREGARAGSLTHSISSDASLSPHTDSHTEEAALAVPGASPAHTFPATAVSAASPSTSTAAAPMPTNLRRVSFSDEKESAAAAPNAAAAAAASAGLYAMVLEKEKSLSLDDLVERPPAGTPEDAEDSWPPPAEEVAAALAARASSPRHAPAQQQSQRQHAAAALSSRAAKPVLPSLRRRSTDAADGATIDLSPRPHCSAPPGASGNGAPGPAAADGKQGSRRGSRTLAFGSYEIDLEALGLPPGTTIEDLGGSPREDTSEGAPSNGDIGMDVQALREEIAQLRVSAWLVFEVLQHAVRLYLLIAL